MSVTHLPIHRSLAILCRLQRGATARAELIDHVLIELGESAYPEPESKACQRAFEQDIKRLRDWGVELAYERAVCAARMDSTYSFHAPRGMPIPTLRVEGGNS